MNKKTFILDSSICIDVWNGGLIDIVKQLPFEFLIPDVIAAELIDPSVDEFFHAGFKTVSLDSSGVQEVIKLSGSHKNISIQDSFALIISRRNQFTLLSGDDTLRKTAVKENVSVHGMLWLLDELVKSNILRPNDAVNSLNLIIENGSRLPPAECAKRIQHWSGKTS